jgi:hypothetical protein
MSKRAPEVFEGDQALSCQPTVGQGELRGLGAGQVPRTVGAEPRRERVLSAHTESQEPVDSRTASAPLNPIAHVGTAHRSTPAAAEQRVHTPELRPC